MAILEWDKAGERLYETGVDRGVLYRMNSIGDYITGEAWNGLTAVTESPSGAEANAQYADNIKYLNLYSAEEFAGTIEAFTYPDSFAECNGEGIPSAGVSVAQQTRRPFGFSYRTRVGNDIEGSDFGYKIHLVYNAMVAPSERAYATINDSPEAMTLSWEFTTTPIAVGDGSIYKPTATLVIDSTKVASAKLKALEDILYGTAGANARLPLPGEVLTIVTTTPSEVTPTEPSFNSSTGEITIPTVVGVEYLVNNEIVTGTFTVPSGQSRIVVARPKAGYTFPPNTDDDWQFTAT